MKLTEEAKGLLMAYDAFAQTLASRGELGMNIHQKLEQFEAFSNIANELIPGVVGGTPQQMRESVSDFMSGESHEQHRPGKLKVEIEEELFSELMGLGIANRVVELIQITLNSFDDRSKVADYLNAIKESRSLVHLLGFAFAWGNSSEGFNYWATICKKINFAEYEKNKELVFKAQQYLTQQ